ncbi:MAG: ATP-binding cassette domain-containing protein [Mesorhizobium sp.]
MNSIEARNIWKSLRGDYVLSGVNLSVRTGEAVGLFGASGSGKSTLFNILLGIIEPDRARVHVDGHPVSGLPTDARARLGLGYVPQRPFIPPHLTVAEAFAMAAEGARIADRAGAVQDVMDVLSISHLSRRPLRKLSGGERRRAEIGYVLVTRPRYLLLDEPFVGLDPLAVDALIATLRGLVESGIGLLIAEHNRVDATRLVGRYYILDNGTLTARPEQDEAEDFDEMMDLHW